MSSSNASDLKLDDDHSGSFTLVQGKKRNAKSKKSEPQTDAQMAVELYRKIEKFKSNLLDYDNELYASKAMFKLKSILKEKFQHAGQNALHLISYGVGSFDDSLEARYQLALILIVVDQLRELEKELNFSLDLIEFYDPVFNKLELSVLRDHYKITIPDKNEKSMHAVKLIDDHKRKCTSLFYMPHCPKALYNNLLYSNWSLDRLSSLIIFGNSFSTIKLLAGEKNLALKYTYLNDSLQLVNEIDLPADCQLTNAFADLKFNLFNIDPNRMPTLNFTNQLKSTYDEISLQAPVYHQDQEII